MKPGGAVGSNDGTLKFAIYNHVYDIMLENEWNRTYAAKQLGVSDRTLRYYLRDMVELGYDIRDGYQKQQVIPSSYGNRYNYPGFATNEQRIKYLDNPTYRGYA